MSFFPKIDRWLIPDGALQKSREEMAADGRHGNEGICLWLGTKENGEARLTHVVCLRGDGVRKSPLNIEVAPELMREVHECAEKLQVILIGQIHSHSRYCGIDLSFTDHRYGVHVPYFLSVVCPDYAQTKPTKISDCGVHVFLPHRGYVRLTNAEIAEQISMITTPELSVPILNVGNP